MKRAMSPGEEIPYKKETRVFRSCKVPSSLNVLKCTEKVGHIERDKEISRGKNIQDSVGQVMEFGFYLTGSEAGGRARS